MAKFDLNNSMYARMWSDSDITFLQTYIDSAALLRSNKDFWKSQMSVSGTITPTASDGTATFTVKYDKKDLSPMADLRSRLGDSTPLEYEGINWYSATIPDFIMPGIVENALERADKEKRFAEYGNDATLVSKWTDQIQARYDGANSTLSNLTAQLLSTGKMTYNFGRGAHSPLHKADIPTGNFLKAGTKVWTAADCPLLDQMAKIESDWRESKGYEGGMIWQIPYAMFVNVFMKNAQIMDFIKQQRTLNDQATTASMVFPQDVIISYISLYPGISPIQIVSEKQRNLTWETDVTVSGWDPKIAVLRPSGYAGEIQHTDNLDKQLFQAYGSTAISKSFATLESGLFHLVNTTLNNGNFKEWHTDVMFAAIPSLTEFPDHLIIDTTVAN